MPKAILEIQIFISCPGDVEAEKNRLIEFFASTEISLTKKGIPAHLKPLYWKSITHQYDGVRGQTIINNEFDGYDHYIGILATRFGTPTTAEDGTVYGSGTEEEFRVAVKAKKENPDLGLYVFFKNVEEPTDPKQKEEYDKVVKFKHELYKDGWVNHFTTPTNLSDKLNEDLIPIIEETIRRHKVVIVSTFKAEAEAKFVVTPEGVATALVTLTDEITVVKIDHPIPRTVTLEEGDEISRMFFSDDYKKELTQLLTDRNHLVLLGDAGSGKSTELAKLVDFYKAPGSLYIPVFSKLKTYKGGPIADLLPEEFQHVPENTALIILDGLDEVETEYFNDALEEIKNFSEAYPLCKIVISCRTNFFELSIGANKGYLEDFTITRINEITPFAIVQTMNEYGIDGEAFYNEVIDCEYKEIVTKPFFLNILSSVYQKQGNLRGGRAKVFAEAIKLRLEAAAVKENLSEADLIRCEQLLTRLALTMEYMGRNYLTNDEFERVVAAEADRIIITKCSIVAIFRGNWSFEHNNIQEYYAARALSTLPVNSVKSFVAFAPDFKLIKPSWLNTMSFLISISSDDQRQPLLDWLIANEPDTLIRFEPDRIDDETRNRIFSAIFKEFQENGLIIRSNKFTEAELGHFADTPESMAIVKEAIGRIGNSISNKITALRLLEYFTLNSEEEKQDVRKLILNFIDQHQDKPDVVYSAVHILARCELADSETVDNFVAKHRTREEDYYRAALYTIITKTGNVDRYIDVFLEGIMMMGKRDHQAHKSSLWDETAQLKRAFEAIREPRAIDTALSFFEEPYDQRYRFYGEKKDVMESLIKQAITLYPEANQFYDRILNIFINYGKTSDRDILQLCREFFEKTGTLTKAYDTVFHLQGLHQIQKNQLLSLALNAETIDFIINEIESGRVKPEDIVRFAEEAYHHTRNTNYAPGAKELKEQLEQRLNITFDDAQLLARQDKRRQYEQDSFDLLFDEPAFKAEADRFWKALGKDAASWSDIWEFANSKEYHLDEYFPRSVTTIIGELSRDTGYITKADADAFMNSGISFEIERIDSIYNLLKNSGLKATDEQIAYLEDWANRTAARLDIKRSIDEHGRFNGLSLMIWYFVKNQHIKLPDDKLLDFTLFYDFIQGDIESWYTPMVEQVGEEAFNARIIENLKSGLKVEHVWSLNAEYAIKKGLKESFDAIKSDLVRINEVTSVKENIAKLYLESTNDHGGLFEVLQQLSPQDFRWELVDLLFNGLKEKIHAYLLEILHSDTSKEYKIAAAKRLTALADEEGFNYYADHGFNNPDVAYRDDLWLSYLTGLKTLNFLPRLTALLEQSLRPENMNDVFRRYDGKVLEALFNMGLQSEKNLNAVTAAVGNVIAKRAPELNYLLNWLKQLDFQYKLNRSQDVSLEAAIVAVNVLGYL